MLRTVSALILSSFATVAGADAPASGIDQFGWLAGCWSSPRSDGFVEEHWLTPAGGAMLGIGRTVSKGSLKEYEFIALTEIDGKLTYVARPVRQAETGFPLVKASTTEFVFENPAHDFPQRLVYRRVGGDELHVRVEATKAGKSEGFDLRFRRCGK